MWHRNIIERRGVRLAARIATLVTTAASPGAFLCWHGLSATGCASSGQAMRLNPEQTPEQYRISCQESQARCRRKAKEVCDGDYLVLEQRSNRPEQPPVSSSNLSSTGPTLGYVDWRGEMTVQCGAQPPRLRLRRATPSPAAGANPAPAPAGTTPSAIPERLCVPGATQACLGPGACSGAQACLKDASGYGPCDCGAGASAPPASTPLAPAPPQPTPSSSAQPLP
jgi:hypothetical protein